MPVFIVLMSTTMHLCILCEVVSAGRLSKPFTLINLDGHSDLYFTQLDEHYDQANDISCS